MKEGREERELVCSSKNKMIWLSCKDAGGYPQIDIHLEGWAPGK